MKWLQSRQNRFLLAAAGTLFAAGAGAWFYASKVEVRRYQLETVDIPTVVGGTGPMPSLKILHISDLHLSRPESHKINFLQKITDEEYDMVVLTGDVFEDFSGLEYASRILKRKPRLGAYAVLGNHDYYPYTIWNKTLGRIDRRFRHPSSVRNVDSMITALENGGFTVLHNGWSSHPEEKIFVLGIDYFGIEESALKSIVAQAPDDHVVLAIQHVPHKLSRLAQMGIDTVFCGHTHGGQVRIPGIGALITDSELSREEASGLLWRDKTAIHVSRGMGADPRSNFRFFCPPHATVVNLHRQSQDDLDLGHHVNLAKRRTLQTTAG